MKKLKINYLLIGIVTLLLAVALWPSIPWFGKAENRIAAIQERGELRVSTLNSPLIYSDVNGKIIGLDYELAQQFADYLGVKLKITVRQNINQLFDDLDNDDADMLAAGLVYNSERSKNYQPGPTYYSVSQQLVYRVGTPELARAIRHLTETGAPFGTYNVTGSGPVCSWADIARRTFTSAGHDPDRVRGVSSAEYFRMATTPVAPRPANSTLDLAKVTATGFLPADATAALDDYVRSVSALTSSSR